MKSFILTAIFFLMLSSPGIAAENVPAPENFHEPRTVAEKALDRILQITDKDFSMLQDVQEHLKNKGSKRFKYSHQFTELYLRAWVKGQVAWLKGACEEKSPKTDPYSDCGYLLVSCVRDAHYPYVYRTEKEGIRTVIISYTWPGSSEAYATYRMIKDKKEWKLDGADCGDVFNME